MSGRRLFVSGIANNASHDLIRMYFSRFGYMSEFTLPIERDTGMNRGFAYITFSDDMSTQKCLEEPSHKIQNKDVSIIRKLFVSFLGVENVTEDSLRQAFSGFGSILSIHFAMDDEGLSLYYAIIKFEEEEAVDFCLRVNHCINGRSITIRKAVTKEQFKLAEQSAREKAHLEEYQKHGYAGYGQSHIAHPLQHYYDSSYFFIDYHSQNKPHEELYRREYQCYQQQIVEYQKQLAEYHEKLKKYHGEVQQYQMQRQYRNALDQATFHNAYNYNFPSQDRSGSSEAHMNTHTDALSRMKDYGYVVDHNCYNFCAVDMLWKILCEDTAMYELPVCGSDYFDKVVLIWKSQCQSVNRFLFGTVLIDSKSEEHDYAVQKAEQLWDIFLTVQDFEVRKLVFKDSMFSQKFYEISFVEDDFSVVFIPVQFGANLKKFIHIPFPYKLCYDQPSEFSLRLRILVPVRVNESESQWIINKMFPAMMKWLRFLNPQKALRKSNSLVRIEEYIVRYKKIKENYGRPLLMNWTEKTDPKKFVYEDCSIATYLLELWRIRNWKPQKFLDLGCGNGLLVYLLNKEGIYGIGIDMRKRKIWSNHFKNTTLMEAVVDPSLKQSSLFDGVDYFIGNHTDELTPWIPIMAARKNCGFFVLPCCPFNFYGRYMVRSGDTGSQYNCFLKFVRETSERLGFIVEEDRLTIPSTKRLCFVCSVPSNGLVSNIENIIEELTCSTNKVFKPRTSDEQVRNRLNVPIDIRVGLINRFFNVLLEKDNKIKDGWRCGGIAKIGELASLLNDVEKKLMKQQCGGLQTFLKNQHQIFKVTSGMVSIRDWREAGTCKFKKSKTCLPHLVRTKCWMFENHPDGCPMKDKCNFKH
ncbi:hypothetical protein DICVIV_01333 [Dictyocaulus viviparus]|uniref:Probable tRNA (uracil-O(2)-)-methyltransferase n=1 Tax=Dictyocaulus viviparus TaxID=29172 RepID=A0A0D8Y8F5_DICVI|nr:hypothetical protein DICVIV_01333 [Dictyocaulus viviparus]